MMNPMQVLYTVGLTVAGSVAIAYTTLWLQNRRRRKRLFESLYHEIVANLSVANTNLEIIDFLEERHKTRKESKADWTYFDISTLYTSSYQDFRLSGEGVNLPREIRMILDETYELILTHNRQTRFLTSEFPPRTGGMSERLKLIIEKLSYLQQKIE